MVILALEAARSALPPFCQQGSADSLQIFAEALRQDCLNHDQASLLIDCQLTVMQARLQLCQNAHTPERGCGAQTADIIWLQRTSICFKASAEAGYLHIQLHFGITPTRKYTPWCVELDLVLPWEVLCNELHASQENRCAADSKLYCQHETCDSSTDALHVNVCETTGSPQWLCSCPIHEGQKDRISSIDTGQESLQSRAAALADRLL